VAGTSDCTCEGSVCPACSACYASVDILLHRYSRAHILVHVPEHTFPCIIFPCTIFSRLRIPIHPEPQTRLVFTVRPHAAEPAADSFAEIETLEMDLVLQKRVQTIKILTGPSKVPSIAQRIL